MVDLRPLGSADREHWCTLRHALWPHVSLDDLDREIAEFDPAGERSMAIGAFDGDTLVGFAEASVRDWGDGCDTAPVGWLEGIYIAPAHRSTGVAYRLVNAVEEWVRSKGLTELGSDALIDNAVSIARHARWGFEETQRVVMFKKALK